MGEDRSVTDDEASADTDRAAEHADPADPAGKTDKAQTPDTVGNAEPATTGDPVLSSYARRMRRARTRYYAVIGVAVLVIGTLVAVAWSKSEIHHVHTRAAQNVPASLQASAFAALPHVQWHTTDTAALGYPLTGGTVVTHDEHTVRGRDALTGAQTWYYRRDDRTVCAAIQQGSVAIALYRLKGACNELTALDAQTGKRVWDRTVDMDGYPLLGIPQIQVTTYSIMFSTPSVIYVLSPTDGGTRYYYAPQNCRINKAVLGNGGLLISQTCTAPSCSGLKFCAPGTQLLLRSATLARSDKYGSDNPDQIQWLLRNNDDIPLSADNPLLGIDPVSKRVFSYTSAQGGRTAVPLSPEPTTTAASTPIAVTSGDVVRIGSTTYLIPVTPGGGGWGVTTSAPVTITPTQAAYLPDLSAAFIAVTGPNGITQLDPSTGKPRNVFAVGATNGLAYPAGSGFVVAGTDGTTVYQ